MLAPTDRLFLEFYAGGNIVLTDKDLGVICLLRIVTEGHEQLRVGLKYSLENRQNYNGVPTLTSERITVGLQKSVEKVDGEIPAPHQKSSKRKPGGALRKALANSLGEFPPMLIDHALRVAAFDPNTPVEDVLQNSSLRERLVVALGEAQKFVDSLTSSVTRKGYIVAKSAKTASAAGQDPVRNADTATGHNLRYEDFQPFRPQQFEDNPEIMMLEFDGFNRTVDEFFSSLESQKLESRLTEREENAKRKLETARLDHQKRLGGLQQVQELNIRKAQAIEANLQKVQEATAAINALISQGMDWQEIARLIEMEQRHNVVAEMIKLPLKLYENTTTLLLSEAAYEEEDDYDGNETGSDVSDSEEDLQNSSKVPKIPNPVDKRLAVDIDLALSPWSNARQYYEQKRSAAVKEQKTLQSSEKALKSTEKKISADLKKGLKQEKEVMRPQRKAMWFEKFVFFISSEGYLVLAGKDAQQNEILYKMYLKKGDIYVQADLQGAASVFIKNKPGMSESPIPPSTLSQAGTLAVATSSAWDSKAVMSAWWVTATQVSKTAPTGEILPTGSFVIQGHKNFLPPAQLLLGFGIMFKVSEASKVNHLKHRIQDPISTPSLELSRHLIDEEDDQDDTHRQESQTEDQLFEADDNEDRELRHVQNAQGAESTSGDDSENDDNSEVIRDNPLKPTRGGHSAFHQKQASDVLVKELCTEQKEETFRESSDKDDESEPGNQAPDLDNSTDHEQKRDLSANETRLDLPSMTDSASAASTSTSSKGNVNPAQISSPPTQPDARSTPSRVRGKHGKHQKLKTKYANQDEEDRALAMRLLGSATALEKATEDAAAKAGKEKELAAQKERRRKQHALAAEKTKEVEELRKLNFEEGIETLDDNGYQGLDELDAFVGAPLPGDDILDALVVCGPWDALGGRYTWKVKLQPGSTKKGKAVREILGKWNSMVTERENKPGPGSGEGSEAMSKEEKVRTREGELIKAIREPEIVGIIPVGKVKVVMGPGEAGGKVKDGGVGKAKRGGKGSKKQR